jgi:hypothetical protein
MAALAMPFVVELTQSFVTSLGRGCESADIIDNLTGLCLGFGVGTVLRWAGPRSTSRQGVDAP